MNDKCCGLDYEGSIPSMNCVFPLGSYTATEPLFPLFVAVLEGFSWYTFQLVGYALLDIIQSTKMAPFQVVFEPGNKKKSQRLRSGEYGLRNHRNFFSAKNSLMETAV